MLDQPAHKATRHARRAAIDPLGYVGAFSHVPSFVMKHFAQTWQRICCVVLAGSEGAETSANRSSKEASSLRQNGQRMGAPGIAIGFLVIRVRGAVEAIRAVKDIVIGPHVECRSHRRDPPHRFMGYTRPRVRRCSIPRASDLRDSPAPATAAAARYAGAHRHTPAHAPARGLGGCGGWHGAISPIPS